MALGPTSVDTTCEYVAMVPTKYGTRTTGCVQTSEISVHIEKGEPDQLSRCRKIKTWGRREKCAEARIFPHGNRDNLKDEIRKVSSTAQFYLIRLKLAMVTFLPLRLGLIYISGP